MVGPLKERTRPSVEFRFRNISSVLAERGEPLLSGYLPANNVGAEVKQSIKEALDEYGTQKHTKRFSFLVSDLPPLTVEAAIHRLVAGKHFEYPESTTYDVVVSSGHRIPPKKIIGLAALIHFGAPLKPEDFAGGEGSVAFSKLREAGVAIESKADYSRDSDDPEGEEFRKRVANSVSVGFQSPPAGNERPESRSRQTTIYERDPSVVAFVERRAGGICELCSRPAPFHRKDGTPFLEVHHVVPLAEGGPDTAGNCAALCPNCHREIHHGVERHGRQRQLFDFLKGH